MWLKQPWPWNSHPHTHSDKSKRTDGVDQLDSGLGYGKNIEPGVRWPRLDLSSATQWTCHSLSHLVVSSSLWPYEPHPSRLLCPWDSPGRNTGVGCHALLQGIFLTQGLSSCLLCLLHWLAGSLPLHHPESAFTTESWRNPWPLGFLCCHGWEERTVISTYSVIMRVQ